MNEPRCPVCHGALNEDPLEGLCARCLSQVLFDPVLDGTAGVPGIATDGLEIRSLVSIPGYTATAELARGGMGIVYRATQHQPGREVALKMLLPHQLGSVEMRQRFQLEARTIATLDHPAILPVYQVGECDGIPYFTMKLAAGGTLSERMQGFRGQWDRIADLMIALADAVHFAHQRGVLHRDLKPGNVLFDESGQPYVSDFGLAKLLEEEVQVTATFDLIGTPRYLPPEVVTGGVAGATIAGDVYGLCTILYEMLAQRPIFEGANPRELMRRIVDDEPERPSALVAEIPADLETICLRGLSKRPAQRFASAAALAADLRRWRAGEPIESRPISDFERLRMWALRHRAESTMGLVILLLLMALVIGAGVATVTMAASRDEIRRERDRTQEELVKSRVAESIVSRLAGRLEKRVDTLEALRKALPLAKSEVRNEVRDEMVANLTLHDFAATDVRLRRLDSARVAGVDPQFRFSAEIAANDEVVFRRLDGTGVEWRWRRLGLDKAASVEFSPNSRFALVSYATTNDVVLDLVEHRMVRFSTGDWGAFSPGSETLLVLQPRDVFHLLSIDSGVELEHWKVAVRAPSIAVFDRNATDSRFLIGRRDRIDLWGRRRPEPILTLDCPTPCISFDWRSDIIAAGGEHGEVYLWNLQAGTREELHAHQGDVDRVIISPDSELLFTCAASGSCSVWHLPTRERIGAPLEWRPVGFDSTGERLAVSTANEIQVLRRLRPTGLRALQVVGTGEAGVREADFSPDGTRIAVVRQDGVGVFRMDTGAQEAFLQNFGAHAAFWSSRGDRLRVLMRNSIAAFGPTGDRVNREWKWKDLERYELQEPAWMHQAAVAQDRRTIAWLAYPDRIGVLRGDFGVSPEWITLGSKPGALGIEEKAVRFWVSSGATNRIEVLDGSGKRFGVREGMESSRPRISPGGEWLLESSRNVHRLTALSTGERVNQFPVETSNDSAASAAWSPDGRLLAMKSRAGLLDVYRSSDWKRALTLPAHEFHEVTWMGFSADGTILGVGFANDLCEFWSLPELEEAMVGMNLPRSLFQIPRGVQGSTDWTALRRSSRSLTSLRGPAAPFPAFDPSSLPDRAKAATPLQLDLGPFFNRPLDGDSLAAQSTNGGGIYPGFREFDGVRFDFRAAVAITAPNSDESNSDASTEPSTQAPSQDLEEQSGPNRTVIRGIPVRSPVRRLHLLGACDYGNFATRGMTVATLVVHYVDGKSLRVPIRFGMEIGDHWMNPAEDRALESAPIALLTLDPLTESNRRYICLYRFPWTNPRPVIPIVEIDLVGSTSLLRTKVSPFWVGITAEPEAH